MGPFLNTRARSPSNRATRSIPTPSPVGSPTSPRLPALLPTKQSTPKPPTPTPSPGSTTTATFWKKTRMFLTVRLPAMTAMSPKSLRTPSSPTASSAGLRKFQPSKATRPTLLLSSVTPEAIPLPSRMRTAASFGQENSSMAPFLSTRTRIPSRSLTPSTATPSWVGSLRSSRSPAPPPTPPFSTKL